MKIFKNYKKAWKIVGIVLLMLALVVFYRLWLSRTKIAFVNFQPVVLQEFAQANDNPMISLYDLRIDDLEDIDEYDVVMVTGMDLRINAAQRAIIQDAANKGLPVFTLMATNPDNNITNFSIEEMTLMAQWMMSGSRKNYRSLLNFLRSNVDGKILFPGQVDLPEKKPSDYLFFPADSEEAEDKEFLSVKDYEQFLRDNGLWHEGGKKLIVTGLIIDPTDLVRALLKENYNVYPVYSMLHLIDFLEEIHPDALINMAHGRLGDNVVEYLKQNNTLFFDPLYVNMETEKWEEDAMGMFGGFMSQSVVMPELDGAIRTSALFALTRGKGGLLKTYAVPERLETFMQTLNNYLALHDKANQDKRVAIVYYKGPGQGNLIATGMDVAASLYNLLKRMKQEGYNLDGLPATLNDFKMHLKREGSLFNNFAQGDVNQYMKTAHPQLVDKEEYDEWCAKTLRPDKAQAVDEQFGAFPGDHNLMETADGRLAFARIQYGNVVLVPQPLAGEGKDVFKITHGTGIVPPHSYIAPYLWMQHAFKADALIHFGAHGSLEYTPQKQVALSNADWSDRLVGAMPHYYIYTVDNVGEAMIARRRSYAGLQSYLTPPFHDSDLRKVYRQLDELLTQYFEQEGGNKKALSLEIKKTTTQLGLHTDLGLDAELSKPYAEKELERIANYQEELAAEKICDIPYIMGVPYVSDDIRSSVYAMTVDPLAYSLFSLDRYLKKAPADLHQHKAQFDRRYLQRAQQLVTRFYSNTDTLTTAELSSITGLSAADIERAHRITAEKNAPKGMIAMMMNSARKDSKTGSADKSSMGHGGMMGNMKSDSIPEPKVGPMAKFMQHQMRKMMAKKDPSKMLEMAKKMGAPEAALKKMEETLKKQMGASDKKKGGDEKDTFSAEDLQLAASLADVEQALGNIGRYRQYLEQSPSMEMSSMMNALNGGYTAPSPGGDPIANPNVLPTGRNMFAINAEETPTEEAWNKGKEMADATIQEYQKRHSGEYPRKVSYTLWSGEFISTGGATIAQALYMLGIEPVRDRYGRVNDIQLIPSEQLGRPRIDVVVQTSGQLRDLAASRLFLINRAVMMAAAADDDTYENHVKAGVEKSEQYLVDRGISPKKAREMSAYRVFGGAGGGYGTGIQSMVEQGNAWEDDKEIAEIYMNNMGAFYGDEENWMNDVHDAFSAALTRTDIVIQPRQSNTWGALSLDHVYEFMGGMNLAVRQVTGEDPDAYFSDYRNRNNYRIQDSKEAIGVEARSKLLNENYIRRAVAGGVTPTDEIAEMVRNAYGWNVMKPKNVDKTIWDEIYNVYVEDKFDMNLSGSFAEVNPSAMQELTATMMETARKGYWKASPEQLAKVAQLHTDFVNKFGPDGSSFEGNNAKLQDFIAQHASGTSAQQYQQLMRQQSANAVSNADNAQVLEKQTTATGEQSEGNTLNGILIVCIVLILFGAMVVMMRRKRNK